MEFRWDDTRFPRNNTLLELVKQL